MGQDGNSLLHEGLSDVVDSKYETIDCNFNSAARVQQAFPGEQPSWGDWISLPGPAPQALSSWSGPAASASPGNFLEMQNLSFTPDLLHQKLHVNRDPGLEKLLSVALRTWRALSLSHLN